MLKAIQQFFNQSLDTRECESGGHQQRLHLAAAALLIEIMEIEQCSEQQEQQLIKVLHQLFGIETGQLITLVDLARREIKDSSDLYQFTRLINDHYSYQEKCRLIHALWQVAFMDQKLDKYEEYTIRKIADLIYVSHSDFIKGKLLARDG